MVAFILVISGFAGLSLTVLSIPRTGPGWDSVELTAFEHELPYEFKSDSFEAALTEESPWCEGCENRGALTERLARSLVVGVYGTSSGAKNYSIELIRWQQVLLAVYFALSGSFVALAIYAQSRSKIASAFTFATYFTAPLLAGHAVMNTKDSPVASGIAMLVAGYIFQVAGKGPFQQRFLAVALMAVGITIAIGTRPSAALIIIVLLLTLEFGRHLSWFIGRPRPDHTIPKIFSNVPIHVTAFLISWVILRETNPYARVGFIEWIAHAILFESKFPWNGDVRVWGQVYPASDLPWFYLPSYLLLETPLVPIIVCAIALMIVPWKVKKITSTLQTNWLLFSLFVFTLGVPVGIILLGSTLYDRSRHLLFLWVLIAVILGLVAAAVGKIIPPRGILRSTLTLFALLTTTSNLVAIAQWWPYHYAFLNGLSTFFSDSGLETDYWAVSAHEGVIRLRESVGSPVAVIPTDTTSWYVGGKLATKFEAGELADRDRYGIYVVNRGERFTFPETCLQNFVIERRGVLLGTGFVCINGEETK